MENDLIYIVKWWIVLGALGVGGLPLVTLSFKKFSDLGYAFSKIIGSLVVTYCIFLFSVLRVIPFSKASLYLVSFFYVALNLFLYLKNRKEINKLVGLRIKTIVFQEVFFAAGLVFWSYVRAHHPDVNGLEKFMDFGFINSILRSKYLPPTDMWFSGAFINYYWFGHLWVAVLTKLSGLSSSVTYNLMLATILGFCLTTAFSISSTLARFFNRKNKKAIFLAGVISAILLTFAGNFHAPYYVLKDGKEDYWYPDATRFIGYNPETSDKTIHEFPIYSFIVSDLHAHLINLPFVLLYIGLLLNYVAGKKTSSKKEPLRLVPLGFLLGVMFMTSTWDFGNYTLLTGVVLLILSLNKGKFKLDSFLGVGIEISLVLIIAMMTTIPFLTNFESIAQGIKFVHSHSPLWQLAILWGFPAILTTIFAFTVYKKFTKLKVADLYVLSLLATCWILITLPEIIFVKDIYIASHYRANTMFKLTYQAFVMSYLSSGYITIRALTETKNLWLKAGMTLIFAAVFSAILIYPRFGIDSFYNELKNYKGLSGETWVKERHPGLYNTIIWFRENVEGQPVILEAPGDSYTEFNLVSAYTGLSTVSGWFVHEWLWRGDSSFPQSRVSDITQIYTSDDLDLTRMLIDKYKVEYIIIGTFERQKFANINKLKFNSLGKAVFTSDDTVVYQLN